MKQVKILQGKYIYFNESGILGSNNFLLSRYFLMHRFIQGNLLNRVLSSKLLL